MNDTVTCAKCNSKSIKTKYVPKGATLNAFSYERVDNDFIRASEYDYSFTLVAKIEHLHCGCRECGYKWRIKCSDS